MSTGVSDNLAGECIVLRDVAGITDLTDLYDNHLFQVLDNAEIRISGTDVITLLNVTTAELKDGDDFIL